jgi:hypothetical protein
MRARSAADKPEESPIKEKKWDGTRIQSRSDSEKWIENEKRRTSELAGSRKKSKRTLEGRWNRVRWNLPAPTRFPAPSSHLDQRKPEWETSSKYGCNLQCEVAMECR